MKNWVVVTGASKGIGKALVKKLLEKGVSICLTARSKSDLAETVAECTPLEQERCMIFPWDLSELSSLSEYVGNIHQAVGPIRGLVHCAGSQKTIPLLLTKKESLYHLFNINTFAGMLLVSLFSKREYFVPQQTSFILLSSVSAHEGSIGQSVYAASKGALEGYIPSASAELIQKGIRLNGIIPGITKTPMVQEFLSCLQPDQLLRLQSSYPLGFGEPIDIANMIYFLLSDQSRWITGQSFTIDGGHTFK